LKKIDISGTITAINNNSSTSINGGKIATGTLSASKITTGTLNGNNVSITNLKAGNIVSGLVEGLIGAIPQILTAAVEIITNLVQGLINSLPSIFDAFS
jgi:hypothetical protein